jgi:hypothetical protein
VIVGTLGQVSKGVGVGQMFGTLSIKRKRNRDLCPWGICGSRTVRTVGRVVGTCDTLVCRRVARKGCSETSRDAAFQSDVTLHSGLSRGRRSERGRQSRGRPWPPLSRDGPSRSPTRPPRYRPRACGHEANGNFHLHVHLARYWGTSTSGSNTRRLVKCISPPFSTRGVEFCIYHLSTAVRSAKYTLICLARPPCQIVLRVTVFIPRATSAPPGRTARQPRSCG